MKYSTNAMDVQVHGAFRNGWADACSKSKSRNVVAGPTFCYCKQ